MDKELLSLIALNSILDCAPAKILSFIEYFGSAQNFLTADIGFLKSQFDISSNVAKKIENLSDFTFSYKEIETAQKNNIDIITYKDKRYPKRLKDIGDYPLILYVKGSISENDMNSVSVVGTRNPTNYGISVTEKFCKYFAKHSITTISGLARGIDAQTHKITLENSGRTIAVLGNGLLQYYPAENRKLQDKVADNGALISEFSLNQRALPVNFPRRNRIVAGLSLATLVVEAAKKSGSLITAHLACEYGKDVFAVPGSICSRYSQGPNNLIKQGAFVATEPEDIINVVTEFSVKIKKEITEKKQNNEDQKLTFLPKDSINILKMIQSSANGIALDKISALSKIDISKLSGILVDLEINGFVKTMPGQVYIAISN